MDVVIGSAVVGFAIAVVLAPYLADVVSVGRGQKSAANSLDTIAKGVDDGVDFTVLRRASLDGTVDIGRVSNRDFSRIDALSPVSGKGAVKRFFDIAAAIALLIATAPLLVVVAAAIRIDSAGPALYRQRRVGINGSVFQIYKLRSMTADAECDGARWASVNDARVTRIGKLIRKLHIDEIPQAINVIKGEMSFVGPRPERPEFVEVLEREIPNYQLRHLVKPGLTGWAQVKYVYGASVEDARIKLGFDLFYIKNYSLLNDILIILMTFRVALFGIGSR